MSIERPKGYEEWYTWMDSVGKRTLRVFSGSSAMRKAFLAGYAAGSAPEERKPPFGKCFSCGERSVNALGVCTAKGCGSMAPISAKERTKVIFRASGCLCRGATNPSCPVHGDATATDQPVETLMEWVVSLRKRVEKLEGDVNRLSVSSLKTRPKKR